MTSKNNMMTFGGHLEVLRRMLVRILIAILLFGVTIFIFKDFTFSILLAPGEWDFATYQYIEKIIQLYNSSFEFEKFHIDLISTNLSSQFMTHITTSLYLGVLCASPYILFELFKFILPALNKKEKKQSIPIVITIYFLFISGVLMSYFILFPISFRFLSTYSVSGNVHSTITLDSYISSFTTLTFLMGVIFQLPIITYILGKMGLISSIFMKQYRRHAFLLICIIAAIITPPDALTMILVTIPLYMLYEISIRVIKQTEKTPNLIM